MSVNVGISPIARQFATEFGLASPGALLNTYASGGSTTRVATYQDAGGTTANTNPIVADASAVFPPIFLIADQVYRFTLTDADGVTIWSLDGISADTTQSVTVSGTIGEPVTAMLGVYLSVGLGGKVAGRWYKVDTALAFSSSEAVLIGSMVAAATTGTTAQIQLSGYISGGAIGGLTAGATIYAGTSGIFVTTRPATNVRVIGYADSTSSYVLQPLPQGVSPDGTIRGPLKGFSHTVQSVALSATTLAFSLLDGNEVRVPRTANIATITITDLPATTTSLDTPIVIFYTGDGNVRTVTSTINSIAVLWAGGTPPSFTATTGKVDIVTYRYVTTGATPIIYGYPGFAVNL